VREEVGHHFEASRGDPRRHQAGDVAEVVDRADVEALGETLLVAEVLGDGVPLLTLHVDHRLAVAS
jgi:hypothetical protein